MQGGERGGPPGCGLLAAVLLCSVAACATPRLVQEDGRWRHVRHGYSITAPGPEWQPVKVKGADLVFRGPWGRWMAFLASCKVAAADPAILARHLFVEIDEGELVQAGPAYVAGHAAWSQVFDVTDPRHLRVKTVTLEDGHCVYDGVLLSPGELGDAEDHFDAWLETLQLGGASAAAGVQRAVPDTAGVSR